MPVIIAVGNLIISKSSSEFFIRKNVSHDHFLWFTFWRQNKVISLKAFHEVMCILNIFSNLTVEYSGRNLPFLKLELLILSAI